MTQNINIRGILMLLALLCQTTYAQTALKNSVPLVLSYQGQIVRADGKSFNGEHSISVSLYSDAAGNTSIWEGSYSTVVTNGIFNILLGSGSSPLPEVATMNKPLWVGIRIEGGEELRPLVRLSSVPYALNVPDRSITLEKLSPELVQAIEHSTVNPTTQSTGQSWTLGGNTLSYPGSEYLGTNAESGGSKDVWLKTNGTTIMRYLPTSNTPNILGGTEINQILNSLGSVICGGGSYHDPNKGNAPNTIRHGNFGLLGGGVNNEIDTSDYCFIGGGFDNGIFTNSSYSTVCGGLDAEIGKNCSYSFVGGGRGNGAGDNSEYTAIVGGRENDVYGEADYVFLGGGYYNLIYNDYSSIIGGESNLINGAGATHSFIGSGLSNTVKSARSVIVGGDTNMIRAGAQNGFIGGGEKNIIASPQGVIVGGSGNKILSGSDFSFAGGGNKNTLLSPYSLISGGELNSIDALSAHASITGGSKNKIDSLSPGAFIGGGSNNSIKLGSSSVIAGGEINRVEAIWGSVGGGKNNRVKGNAAFGTIPGGRGLIAQSYGQTVTGVFNSEKGSSNEFNFKDQASAHANDALFIVGNGTPSQKSNAFEISNNGHSTVYDQNGSGGATQDNMGSAQARPMLSGSTYTDNVIYAWGDVDVSKGAATVKSDFGVANVERIRNGVFVVTLNIKDPSTSPPSSFILRDASISVSIVDNTPVASTDVNWGFANVSQIGKPGANQFIVRTYGEMLEGNMSSDKHFMFKVTGRGSSVRLPKGIEIHN